VNDASSTVSAPGAARTSHCPTLLPLTLCAAIVLVGAAAATAAETDGRTARGIYMDACASCHGADGRGLSKSRVGFDDPLPDFTECNFATREPVSDWIAVAHQGGPVRGFSHVMPSFGAALGEDEIALAVAHIRTFCPDGAWPRGELNFPRPIVTEKAFPEDEAVLTAVVPTEGEADAVDMEIVYEHRFGARNQFELVVPFGWAERVSTGPGEDGGDWTSGVGDIALGVKRAVWHSLEKGAIVAVTAEVVLPTGDEDAGFGKGTAIFEPFVSYGQALPAELFLHAQAGLELPADTDRAEEEAFLRAAIGRKFTAGRWGRAFSPMIEILGARELAGGAATHWDIAPQLQVTLNTRQHISAAFGVRAPLNDTSTRDTQLMAYLLWEWFDGNLFEGW